MLLMNSCKKDVSKNNTNSVVAATASEDEAAVFSDDVASMLEAGKYKIYTIAQNAHYCSPNPFKLTAKSQLKFNVILDSSCIYATVDPLNQYDVNKIYGFSDCNSQHLDNSARIGWTWYDNVFHITAFVHNDGAMLIQEVATAHPKDTVNCRITCLSTTYQFEVNGVVKELARHCSGSYTRYFLYPYFGGDEAAPHAMKIQIQNL